MEDLSEESLLDESAGAYAYKPIGTSSVDVRMIDFDTPRAGCMVRTVWSTAL